MKSVNRRFVRHYIEMVVVMFLGMAILGVPAGWALRAAGTSWGDLSPTPMLLLMAFTMTAPMVAWMRRMGHSWADCWEMTAFMVLPMFALVLPVALGLDGYVPGLSARSLMLLSHVAMIGGMVLLMLYRWDRYAGGPHCHRSSGTSI